MAVAFYRSKFRHTSRERERYLRRESATCARPFFRRPIRSPKPFASSAIGTALGRRRCGWCAETNGRFVGCGAARLWAIAPFRRTRAAGPLGLCVCVCVCVCLFACLLVCLFAFSLVGLFAGLLVCLCSCSGRPLVESRCRLPSGTVVVLQCTMHRSALYSKQELHIGFMDMMQYTMYRSVLHNI
jgi:hypothetical protein